MGYYHNLHIVNEPNDLRKILSDNIRTARKSLHISQTKLAEYAEISIPYMTDIEHCRTWVSDKTLVNIARALNMKAHELLTPFEDKSVTVQQSPKLEEIAELIKAQKIALRKASDEIMDDLMAQIIRLYSR